MPKWNIPAQGANFSGPDSIPSGAKASGPTVALDGGAVRDHVHRADPEESGLEDLDDFSPERSSKGRCGQ